jgi:hypothetical protein
MAIAIKEFTARQAYRDLTQTFTDSGRLGKIVNCPQCSTAYVLYFGGRLNEQEATEFLEKALPRCCPEHKGWLAFEEDLPVCAEDHHMRVQEVINRLQHEAEADYAAAQINGPDRERLIVSAKQREAEINELRNEM